MIAKLTTSFSLGDLQTALALIDAGQQAGYDLAGLRDGLRHQIAAQVHPGTVRTDTRQRVACPSCGRGFLESFRFAGTDLSICVNRKGKAGCGWSEML